MVDINTTPLIDVMLVLLVMLIITLPIQLHSVNLNMPTGNPPPPLVKPEVVKLDIDPSSVVYWNGEACPTAQTLEDNIQRAPPPGGAARSAPAARQGRQVRDRGRRHGLGAAARPDQDRHRRQRAVHQRLGDRRARTTAPPVTSEAQHGLRATATRPGAAHGRDRRSSSWCTCWSSGRCCRASGRT